MSRRTKFSIREATTVFAYIVACLVVLGVYLIQVAQVHFGDHRGGMLPPVILHDGLGRPFRAIHSGLSYTSLILVVDQQSQAAQDDAPRIVKKKLTSRKYIESKTCPKDGHQCVKEWQLHYGLREIIRTSEVYHTIYLLVLEALARIEDHLVGQG